MAVWSQPAAAQVVGGQTPNSANITAAQLPANAIWIGRQTFCASGCTATGGTYTPTAGTNEINATCVGGAGAGGGAGATGAAQVSIGAGGGAAAVVQKRITSAFSGVTVTIGPGGIGVAGGAGNNGADTTFGALLTAAHGSGGGSISTTSTAGSTAAGGAGGTASGGDIPGLNGQPGFVAVVQQATAGVSAQGGSPGLWGQGGTPIAGTGSGSGNAGTGFGAGGSGAVNGPSQAGTQPGGAGSGGLCLVEEYR